MVNSSTFQNKQIPFSTGICSGNVTDNLLNGICANGQGLPTSPYVTYNVTPLTAQVNNVALSQSVLNETTLVLTAGTGVTLITDPNSPYFGCLELDCPRALQFIIGSTGAPNIANITIDGYPGFSSYTRRTQEQITTTTTAGQIFYTNKTYRFVKSITVSGGVGTGGTVSVGTSDILGLPFFVKSPQDIVSKKWLMLGGTFALTNTTPVVVSPSGVPAGASITLADVELDREQTILVSPNPIGYFTITATTNTSFSVTGSTGDNSIIGYNVDYSKTCRIIIGDITTPSLTTGDPIGKIALGTPSDGVTTLEVTQYLRQTDILPSTQTINDYIGLTPYNNL